MNIVMGTLAAGALAWIGCSFLGFDARHGRIVSLIVGTVGGIVGARLIAPMFSAAQLDPAREIHLRWRLSLPLYRYVAHASMCRTLVAGLTTIAALTVGASTAGAGLFSSRGPVIAIVAGELFLGEAEGDLGGTGTIRIRSSPRSNVTCEGQFTFSAEHGDVGTLQCSDGVTATIQFKRLSLVRGYGTGSTSRGPMSFTYGLDAAEAARYLELPPGKGLALEGNVPVLIALKQPVPARAPASGPSAAGLDTAPDVLLSTATTAVIADLRQHKNLGTTSAANIAALVESTVLPLFSFRHMTQLAVASNWRLASPQQQDALIAEFRTLLVRTYSTALASYRDQTIEYQPLRTAPGDTEVTVKSTMRQPGTERMTIDYDLEKTTEGWKVYDIKIAGMSLVTTYRSNFAQTVRDRGVDGLIAALAAKNRQAVSGLGARESAAQPLLSTTR